MALVTLPEMLADAKRGRYAVGYFESWNLESLLAVADAAVAMRSPVILGFSGIYLPHADRVTSDPLEIYADMALRVARSIDVPACVLFNESPHRAWVERAIDCGFNAVMFSDEEMPTERQRPIIRELAVKAHNAAVAIEGEVAALHGVGGDVGDLPSSIELTSPQDALAFVEQTNVDALAVNVGQVHLHGRSIVRLSLDRISQIADTVDVPLVLHGATSVGHDDLREAISRGICKVNVGSVLKQHAIRAMTHAISLVGDGDNPYEVIGSGLSNDILIAGRLAVQNCVEQFMDVFGSSGRANQLPSPTSAAVTQEITP